MSGISEVIDAIRGLRTLADREAGHESVASAYAEYEYQVWDKLLEWLEEVNDDDDLKWAWATNFAGQLTAMSAMILGLFQEARNARQRKATDSSVPGNRDS